MEFIEIMDRVSTVVEKHLGMKPTDMVIAKYLDITATNFANMKKRNRIPYEELVYFSAKHNISVNWILLNQHCDTLVAHEEKYYSLRVIDNINASCGGGGVFEDDEITVEYIKLGKDVLNKLGYSSTNNLDAIKVMGESMFPTLKENDLVLIDRSSINYNSESIFLVNTTSGLFVKRLRIYDDNKIDLISDNENYSNSTFCVDEVTIIGKVLGILELNEDEEKVDKNEEKIKIKFSTGYVEFIDNKYRLFSPDEDYACGHDPYTDEPIYDLQNNQFHAIVIECELYEELTDNNIYVIESGDCVTLSNNYGVKDDYFAFLFEDFHSYFYEFEKLTSFSEE